MVYGMAIVLIWPTHRPATLQSLEVVWPQPPAPSPPRPATNRTTFLTDDFEQDPLTGGLNTTLWSNFMYGIARLGNTTDTCGQALYGNGSFVLGPESYRQLQPMTVPANATWSVHALLACDAYGYDVTVVLEYSDDDEATWLEAWSPGPNMPLGEWRRYGFSLPLEKDTFVHLRFRRPADSARQAVVALDRLVSVRETRTSIHTAVIPWSGCTGPRVREGKCVKGWTAGALVQLGHMPRFEGRSSGAVAHMRPCPKRSCFCCWPTITRTPVASDELAALPSTRRQAATPLPLGFGIHWFRYSSVGGPLTSTVPEYLAHVPTTYHVGWLHSVAFPLLVMLIM